MAVYTNVSSPGATCTANVFLCGMRLPMVFCDVVYLDVISSAGNSKQRDKTDTQIRRNNSKRSNLQAQRYQQGIKTTQGTTQNTPSETGSNTLGTGLISSMFWR